MPDIVQACRNAWTACGLQPLLGARLELTPSILGYSLLYPYTDNFFDRTDITAEEKRRFSERFRGASARRANLHPEQPRIRAVGLGGAGRRPATPAPAIPRSSTVCWRSTAPRRTASRSWNAGSHTNADILRVSCAKGGSSVLADACLANGWLSEQQSRFAFEWGVLLQLGDDLQDVREASTAAQPRCFLAPRRSARRSMRSPPSFSASAKA